MLALLSVIFSKRKQIGLRQIILIPSENNAFRQQMTWAIM